MISTMVTNLKRKIEQIDADEDTKRGLLDHVTELERAPELDLQKQRSETKARVRAREAMEKPEADLINDIVENFYIYKTTHPWKFAALIQHSEEFHRLRLAADSDGVKDDIVCFGEKRYTSNASEVQIVLEDVVRDVIHKIENANEPRSWKQSRAQDKKKPHWRDMCKMVAGSMQSSTANLKAHTDLVKASLWRLKLEPTQFDTDGHLLGGEDGLLESSGDSIEFREHSFADFVTMSVGYDVKDLESERGSEAFKTLEEEIVNKLLPVKEVRKDLLALMAKIAFDGFYAWKEKMILWFIAPKDYAKTTLTRLFCLTLGEYAVTEETRIISDPPVVGTEWASFLKRVSKSRFIRLDEGIRRGKYSWLTIKKLSSSSTQTYRELYQLRRKEVDRIGMIGVSCNPAEAPERPDSNDDLGRCIVFDRTMLTCFGEVEDPKRRMAIKLTQWQSDNEFMPYRRAFLLLLKDYYRVKPLAFGSMVMNARDRWEFGDVIEDSSIPEDEGIVETSTDVIQAPLAISSHMPLINWMHSNFVQSPSDFIRLGVAYDELLKDKPTFEKTKPAMAESAIKGEICNLMRMCVESAVGAGNVFLQGSSNNKTVYYSQSTAIGKARGGCKVPGWHLPGFKLLSNEGSPSTEAATL